MPNKILPIQLIFWSISFFLLSFIYLFYKRKANYIKTFLTTTSYYIFLSTLVRIIFNHLFSLLSFKITPLATAVLILTTLGNLTFYIFTKKTNHDQIHNFSKTIQYIHFDYRYLIANTADIIFQQIMTVTTLLLLLFMGINKLTAILTFGLFFTIAHIIWFNYMCKKQKTPQLHARVINILSLIGSFIMAYLILEVPSGFIYSFLLHFTTYTCLGLFFRNKQNTLISYI